MNELEVLKLKLEKAKKLEAVLELNIALREREDLEEIIICLISNQSDFEESHKHCLMENKVTVNLDKVQEQIDFFNTRIKLCEEKGLDPSMYIFRRNEAAKKLETPKESSLSKREDLRKRLAVVYIKKYLAEKNRLSERGISLDLLLPSLSDTYTKALKYE